MAAIELMIGLIADVAIEHGIFSLDVTLAAAEVFARLAKDWILLAPRGPMRAANHAYLIEMVSEIRKVLDGCMVD